jgi:peptide/nickel transport system substrate-binding protein
LNIAASSRIGLAPVAAGARVRNEREADPLPHAADINMCIAAPARPRPFPSRPFRPANPAAGLASRVAPGYGRGLQPTEEWTVTTMTLIRRSALIGALAVALGAGALLPAVAQAQTTLRVVMHSDLKIVDPIWTTAYITRNHGYMIYDTLFAVDANNEVKPQMVDKWSVSTDQLTWSFTLREGLLFHDKKPVTSEDVIASLRRWGAKDAMGQKLMTFVKDMKAVDQRSFTINLNSPTGLMLLALGKPSSNVPFIMPKRIADTGPNDQIGEYVGSGPFVFRQEEWKPGDRAVYTRFQDYKPRSEPASGLAGGKVVKVDRVEWRTIPDHQTAVNALTAGEIDMIEQPPHDLLPVVRRSPDVVLFDSNPLGNQYAFRFNVLHKPFDNVKVRQALFHAFNQEDFLKAVIGDPQYYKPCKALFVCGTPFATDKGMEDKLESNFKQARELLKEAGYDGTPVLLMHSTDLQVLTNLAPVAKSLMERAGFKVDMQSMDWQTVVARRAKKEPPAQGGWNAFITSWVAADVLNPIGTAFLNSSCDKALFGWPCDEEMEKLRDSFARATDSATQRTIAERVQLRLAEYPTHIHLGQWYQPVAMRKNVTGMLVAPVPVLWNVEKK